jgi:hypothetical protein
MLPTKADVAKEVGFNLLDMYGCCSHRLMEMRGVFRRG